MGLLPKSSLKNITIANYSDLNFLCPPKNTERSPDTETIDHQKLAVESVNIFNGSWPFIDPAQITQVARTKSIRKRNKRKRRTIRQQKKLKDSKHYEIDDETVDLSIKSVSSSFKRKLVRENRIASNSSSTKFSLTQLHAQSRNRDEDEKICQVTLNTSSEEIAQADYINVVPTDCGYPKSYSSSQKEELQNQAELSEYPEYFMNVLHIDNNTENDEYNVSSEDIVTPSSSKDKMRCTRFKKFATRGLGKTISRNDSIKKGSGSNTGREPLRKNRHLRNNMNYFKMLKRKRNKLIEKKKHRKAFVANDDDYFPRISDDDLEREIKRGMNDAFTRDKQNIVVFVKPQIHFDCNARKHFHDSRNTACTENTEKYSKKNLKNTATAIWRDIEAHIRSDEIKKNVEKIREAISEISTVKPNAEPGDKDLSKDIFMEYDWADSNKPNNENVLSQDSKQSSNSINVDPKDSSAIITAKSARRNKRYRSSIDCKFVDGKETAYQSLFHDCVDLDSPRAASSLKINMDESWKSEDSGVEMIHSSWRRSTLTEEHDNEFDSALLLARKIVSDDSTKGDKCYDDETLESTCYKHQETSDILPATKKNNSIQTDRNNICSDDNVKDINLINQLVTEKEIITYKGMKNKKKISKKASKESVNPNPAKDVNEDIKVRARITKKVNNKDLTKKRSDEKVNDLEYDSDEKYVSRRVTRALVKTNQEDSNIGKLVWGFCSGWWPALIVDAEHVGMAAESGKLWVYWIGEAQISLLNEKTQIQPFSTKLEHRLMQLTSRKNIRSRAINATIQMLHQRFPSTLTKPYYNWIQRNITGVQKLDDLTFYPYPDNVQEKLNKLKEKNIKAIEKYKLSQNNSSEASPTKKPNTEKNKEPNIILKQIEDERLPLQNQYPGVIAWAKIAGHNWWPAMIIDYRDCCLKEPSFGCQWIMWYGDYQVSEVRHLEFLKFDKGLQKMRSHIQSTVKQSYIEGVLQASKDYCSRLGCNTDNWTLDNVFEYFSKNNIHVAHNQLQVSESNRIYDKYSNEIVKKMNKFMSKPNVDAERKSDIKASDALRQVISGECAVEKLCLKCLKFPKGGEMEAHPFFKGSLCRECSNAFKPCMFVHGTDGKCFYCTICGATGTVFICDIEDCPRVYCTACLKFLLYPKSYDDMLSEDPWECPLCRDDSRQPVDAIVHPRFDWKEKFMRMFRTVSNFVPDDLELVSYKKEKKPIRVLSLFDGLSTGLLVLLNLGIAVEAYYASEIDINALTISSAHFGDRITHLGDVRNITEKQIKEITPIDLLIGGSPCNDLSLVNPARLGLHDYKGTGVLFFDYCRIKKLLEKVNKGRHLFWLFENVASMPAEYRLEINKHLGQEPDVIDAADFSPQHRLRLYWHNFPFNPYMPLFQNRQDVQDKLTPNLQRKALCKKLRTVTSRKGSLLQVQGKLELKPIMMKGESDTLWITELEEIFGFPRHYTDVKNLSATNRQKLLGRSWSVQTLTAILRPLCFYFKCNEDEINKFILQGNTSFAK